MRNQVWDASTAELHSLDLAELVLCLGLLDTVDGEAALGIIDKTEVFTGLLDGDHIHITRRVGNVGSDLAIDLDQALHQDGSCLAVVQGVLEAVSEEDNQRETVAGFLDILCQSLTKQHKSAIQLTWGPGDALGA
jgi:hypothetical protein